MKSQKILYTMLLSLSSMTLYTACGDSSFEINADDKDNTNESALRVCAQGPTVKGIDVSTFQETVDWQKVKNDGFRFGIARISDGTRFIDEQFDRNWREIKGKGLVRGSYQFFRPTQSAEQQANIVVQKVGKLGPGDLPVVLDIETADGASSATIRSKMRTWIDIVERGTGKKPIIYAASGFWDSLSGMSEFSKYDLWVANYGVSCPFLPNTWGGWRMWQFTDTGAVTGIRGGVDINHFHGSLEQLIQYAGGDGSTNPTPTPATQGQYEPLEVYWARLSDGSYKLHALATPSTVRVEYYVDGFKIDESTRAEGDNFPGQYTFQDSKNERLFEIRGFDANNKQISRGVGLIDVTDGVGVYIRQLSHTTYEIGLERAPSGVAGLEVEVDGQFVLTDSVQNVKRSTRGAVRSVFSIIGERDFKLTTYNADGSVRGSLRRSFNLPAVKGMDSSVTIKGEVTNPPAPTPPAPTPSTPTTAQGLAQTLISLHNAAELTLWAQNFNRNDGAGPLDNMTAAAAGRLAKTSCGGRAPCTSVSLKAPLLKGMHDLQNLRKYSYFVTSIAGAEHSVGSLHYQGRAFDVDEVNGVRINGDSQIAREFMEACRQLGAIEVFGPSNDPAGHFDHIHCAW